MKKQDLILVLKRRLEVFGIDSETSDIVSRFLIDSEMVTYSTLFDECYPPISPPIAQKGEG